MIAQQWLQWLESEPPAYMDGQPVEDYLKARQAHDFKGTQIARQVMQSPSTIWPSLSCDDVLRAHGQINSLYRMMFGRDTAALYHSIVPNQSKENL